MEAWRMDLGEEFVKGNIVCEVDGCREAATVSVKDFLHLHGQSAYPIDAAQVGPFHFFCKSHRRDSRTYERIDGQLVRVS
jgi:hypothetical protein